MKELANIIYGLNDIKFMTYKEYNNEIDELARSLNDINQVLLKYINIHNKDASTIYSKLSSIFISKLNDIKNIYIEYMIKCLINKHIDINYIYTANSNLYILGKPILSYIDENPYKDFLKLKSMNIDNIANNINITILNNKENILKAINTIIKENNYNIKVDDDVNYAKLYLEYDNKYFYRILYTSYTHEELEKKVTNFYKNIHNRVDDIVKYSLIIFFDKYINIKYNIPNFYYTDDFSFKTGKFGVYYDYKKSIKLIQTILKELDKIYHYKYQARQIIYNNYNYCIKVYSDSNHKLFLVRTNRSKPIIIVTDINGKRFSIRKSREIKKSIVHDIKDYKKVLNSYGLN